MLTNSSDYTTPTLVEESNFNFLVLVNLISASSMSDKLMKLVIFEVSALEVYLNFKFANAELQASQADKIRRFMVRLLFCVYLSNSSALNY